MTDHTVFVVCNQPPPTLSGQGIG